MTSGAGYPSSYYPYIIATLVDTVPQECGGTGGQVINSIDSGGGCGGDHGGDVGGFDGDGGGDHGGDEGGCDGDGGGDHGGTGG